MAIDTPAKRSTSTDPLGPARRLAVLLVGLTSLSGALFVSLGAESAGAVTTCYVPSEYSSLQTALTTSGCGTIYVSQGTYTGSFSPNHSVTVIGQAEGTTILSGGGAGTVFTNSGGYTVYLTDLTITDGTSSADPGAGGIMNFPGGNLTLRNVTVTANTETAACIGLPPGTSGAINNQGTMALIATSVIRNTSAPGYGSCSGGISNFSGTMTISGNSIVAQNAGGCGGGVANNAGILNIYQSSVTGNTAFNCGGGVYDGAGHLFMSGVAITGNSAGPSALGGYGGGLFDVHGTVTIVGGLIANNSAVTGTGALPGGGGGIYLNGSILNMSGSGGVANNFTTVSSGGGGIYNHAGTENLAPSITIKGNQPDNLAP